MRHVCLFYYLSDTKILFTTRSHIIISGTDFISFPTEEKRCGLWWVERSFWIPYQKFQNPPLITECLGIKEGLNSWVAPRFYYHLSLCCRYTTDPLIVTLLHPNHTKSIHTILRGAILAQHIVLVWEGLSPQSSKFSVLWCSNDCMYIS